VNLIAIDNAANPITIPRHFFREPPDYAVMYEVTADKTSVFAMSLWKPGQEPIPVAVQLPTPDGFVDADRQTVQLFEALKRAVRGSAVSRLVDSRLHAVVWIDVNSFGAASTERNASLLGYVTVHARTVQPSCLMSSFTWGGTTTQLTEAVVYMVTQTHEKPIRQLCGTVRNCAEQIADDVTFWIDQNFPLARRREK
jgi:hypothetical protein